MLHNLLRLVRDDRGQGFVEYGLILALVAVLLIAAMLALRSGLGNVFGRATDCMNNAAQGQGC